VFHILDAVVILIAFVVSIVYKGPIQQAFSLVIVLRLWRIYSIIEEHGDCDPDQMEDLQHRVEDLESERVRMKKEISTLRQRLRQNGSRDVVQGDDDDDLTGGEAR